MNVCTHSYSLWPYGWAEWQQFIDWQALWGVNLNLAMTGQEEIQWKVSRPPGRVATILFRTRSHTVCLASSEVSITM